MRALRAGSWISLVAVTQLLLASTARAQDAPPPAGAPLPAAPFDAAPPPPLPGAVPAPAPAVPQAQDGAPGPVVRITSTNPAARLQTMRLKWQDVCTTPCGVAVDPRGTYRIGGGSIRPSEEFRMPRPSGNVLITTETGSTVKHWVGFGMVLGGAVAAASGAALYAIANDNSNLTSTQRDSDKAIGITYLVVGAIVAIVGIPFAASSTSVDVR